jgi:hypothetical protein
MTVGNGRQLVIVFVAAVAVVAVIGIMRRR